MINQERVRLDKWLWAARFFKTRSIARTAIDGGKVHYQGNRVKAGKLVHIGAHITIRIGFDEREIVVQALSEQRGTATTAQELYYETEASLERREKERLLRKLSHASSVEKPNKKQRRQIHQFVRKQTTD